jgi:hypothetical protein
MTPDEFQRLAPRPPDAKIVAEVLPDCHAWLAAEILDWLIAAFQPFYAAIPMAMLRTSAASLAWTLVAREAETAGPAPVLRRRDLLASAPFQAPARAGDLISRHLAIERLVGVSPGSGSNRQIGHGLRSPAFLAGYGARIARTTADDDRREPEADLRQAVVDLLVAANPLTRLVYPDLVATVVPTARGADPGPLLTAGRGAWMAIWHAQLARSLVAGMLAPSLTTPELERVERQRRERRAQAKPQWWFVGKQPRKDIATLEERQQALRRRIAAEVAGRLRIAHMLVRHPHAGDQDPGAADGLLDLLRIRVLDMFVRHVVALALPQLEQDWIAARRPTHAGALAVLAEPLLHTQFERALFAQEPGVLRNLLGDQAATALRDQAFAFLNPPVVTEDEVRRLAIRFGFPRQEWIRLVQRFSKEAGEIPVSFTDERLPSPAALLATWLPGLRARLSQSGAAPAAQSDH